MLQARGEDVIPIPGTKNVKYLEENLGALKVKLSDADIAELEAAVPHDEVRLGRLAYTRGTSAEEPMFYICHVREVFDHKGLKRLFMLHNNRQWRLGSDAGRAWLHACPLCLPMRQVKGSIHSSLAWPCEQWRLQVLPVYARRLWAIVTQMRVR